MSFYLRKSIKVGPVRFNLSKSGIGVSTGIKGFRVGSGPRGNYVHMGLGGVYYRKTFPQPGPNGGRKGIAQPLPGQPAPAPPVNGGGVAMKEIESGDVSRITHSSSDELMAELNAKKKIPRIGPWVLAGTILLLGIMMIASVNSLLILIVAIFLGLGVYTALMRDALKKTTVLMYEFDPAVEKVFGVLHSSAKQLASCRGCWHIAASGKVHDKKYHAGASALVDRKSTWIRAVAPDFIKTNIETVAVGVGKQTLYFFPDRLLVYDEGRIGAVGYDELRINVRQARFIEDGSPPSDARVVDRTWRYVNKGGGPDKRFANNPQLPICLYDELHFSSRTGLNEIVQVSRCGVGDALAESMKALARHSSMARVR